MLFFIPLLRLSVVTLSLRYRNSEGYSDPTAFFARRNVMKPAGLKHRTKTEKKRHPRTQVVHYD